MPAARVNLLCLPCAGASATMYLRWRRLLPAWVRLVPVELPGRGARLGEPFAEDFEPLVTRLCDEQASSMAGAFVLFGHSMGGLLAWGMAQRLRELKAAKSAAQPAALFVSGCPAPTQRAPMRFADLDSDTQLVADLRRQGGTPDEVFASPEMLRITLDALRADYRICVSTPEAPRAPLPMPIHAFGGRQDDIAASRIAAWQRETRSLFSLAWLDGGHFFIRQSEPQLLAALVREMQPLRLDSVTP